MNRREFLIMIGATIVAAVVPAKWLKKEKLGVATSITGPWKIPDFGMTAWDDFKIADEVKFDMGVRSNEETVDFGVFSGLDHLMDPVVFNLTLKDPSIVNLGDIVKITYKDERMGSFIVNKISSGGDIRMRRIRYAS